MTEPHDQRRDVDCLYDMVEYAQRAISFCINLDVKQFEQDTKTMFAVTYCLQTIGEASTHISNATKQKIKDVPWNEMKAMRNILVHAYHNADFEVIWSTVKGDLPLLVKEVKKFLGL